MAAHFPPSAFDVPLEDSRLGRHEILNIKWLEELGVVWDSHVVEFVRFDTGLKEFQIFTIVTGTGPDMEEIKYRSRDSLGSFVDPWNLNTLTIDGILMDDLEETRMLIEHPRSEQTYEEWAEMNGNPDGINRGLDWT